MTENEQKLFDNLMEHNSAYYGYELSKGEIKTVLQAFEQLKQYRAIGTPEGYERAIESSIENYNLYKEYKAKVQDFEVIEEFVKQLRKNCDIVNWGSDYGISFEEVDRIAEKMKNSTNYK